MGWSVVVSVEVCSKRFSGNVSMGRRLQRILVWATLVNTVLRPPELVR